MTLDELKNRIDGLILKAVAPDLEYEDVVRLEDLAQIRNDLEQLDVRVMKHEGPIAVKINGLSAFTAEDISYEEDIDNGRCVNITTPFQFWMQA